MATAERAHYVLNPRQTLDIMYGAAIKLHIRALNTVEWIEIADV